MATTYTVKTGDCLWNIAKSQLGDPYRWTEIADLNKIPRSKPVIHPGQKLQMPGSTSSTTTNKNTSNKATINFLGLEAGTTTLFATWKWDKDSTTEGYEVIWQYYTANNRWFNSSDTSTTVKSKEAKYNPPDNAKKVRVKVKPISKTETKNNTEVSVWTAVWSDYSTYNISDNPPSTPSTPTVTIEKLKLTARLDNLDVNATEIEFEVVKDDSKVFATAKAKIITSTASYTFTVNAGSNYKVRCRAVRGSMKSDWSQYSSNAGTQPSATDGITICRAESETSVYLEWKAVSNAETYDIEYAEKLEYFDGSDQTTVKSGIEFTHYIVGGLETGNEYLFRVRAANSNGSSPWSKIVSVRIGTTPAAPTTWSSTTTGITGDSLTLYWIHNSEDGSPQTYAEVELTINGKKNTYTVNTVDEEDDEKTMYYEIDTSSYTEGTKILWRVRTAGVTKTYGEWSIQRTVDIYAPPTLMLELTDVNGTPIETLKSFPMYVRGTTGPNTQEPIGYHVTITANSGYETIDNIGNKKVVIEGEEVYSKYFDTNEQLVLQISADSVNLDNNIEYTITCVSSMNSGLTAEASVEFIVEWIDEEYSPSAEIGINTDDLSAYIRPYCLDENGELLPDVTLSVYRREYDGTFTEIATGLDNLSNTYVTDPHPALDFARYRIIAITNSTGAVSFYDPPGYPVQEKAIIIQWNEYWTNFETDTEDELDEKPWRGSMVKLPYNVDVTEKKSRDISLINYIGRTHPVSYYGTYIGETGDWKAVIEKSDTETLYALRKLSIWMGDVYVREPSGTGYWATADVSFGQTHNDPTIPVTINITRVEGGA